MAAPTQTIERSVTVDPSTPTRLDSGGLGARQFVSISNTDQTYRIWYVITANVPQSLPVGAGTPLDPGRSELEPVGPGLYVYAISENPSGSSAFVREYQ